MKIILSLLVLSSCVLYPPKFEKGDCITFVVDYEFYANRYYDLVTQVGKTHYKFAGYKNSGRILDTDLLYTKTSNEHCEGMK